MIRKFNSALKSRAALVCVKKQTPDFLVFVFYSNLLLGIWRPGKTQRFGAAQNLVSGLIFRELRLFDHAIQHHFERHGVNADPAGFEK